MTADWSSARFWRSAVRGRRALSDHPGLAFELMLWRVMLPLLKRGVSVPRLARWMWMSPGEVSPAERLARIASIRRLTAFGGRWLLSSNCLERSLVLYRLFSGAAAQPTLVLGMRAAGPAAGHAWIEVDGKALGEEQAGTYERVIAIGAGGQILPA